MFYPNPVKDVLHFSDKIHNIRIMDISGKSVKQIPVSSKSVNLSNLTKGNYIITATTKTGVAVAKKIVRE